MLNIQRMHRPAASGAPDVHRTASQLLYRLELEKRTLHTSEPQQVHPVWRPLRLHVWERPGQTHHDLWKFNGVTFAIKWYIDEQYEK